MHQASGVSPALLTAGPCSERGWKKAAGGTGLELVLLGGGPLRKLQKMTVNLVQNAAAESLGEVNLHSAHSREGGGDVGDALTDFPPAG